MKSLLAIVVMILMSFNAFAFSKQHFIESSVTAKECAAWRLVKRCEEVSRHWQGYGRYRWWLGGGRFHCYDCEGVKTCHPRKMRDYERSGLTCYPHYKDVRHAECTLWKTHRYCLRWRNG